MFSLVALFLFSLCSLAIGQLDNGPFEAYKKSHPEEFSGKFEGDMDVRNDGFRNALIGSKRWVNGIVYYNISQVTAYTKRRVRLALDYLEMKVGPCIKFKERTSEPHYVNVINGRGCYSAVGRTGGIQELSLSDPGCLGLGTIQHEFLHALGFTHEQSRTDRDKYLDIHWENIKPEMKYNFDLDPTNNLEMPYEYGSVMHYGEYAFSMNGRPTMTPKKSGAEIGTRKLHSRDIEMIRRHYGCYNDDGHFQEPCTDVLKNCKRYIRSCRSPQFQNSLAKKCEKTCGFCDNTPLKAKECTDENENCSTYGKHCNHPEFSSTLKVICKKTCNHCS
ncbi:hatching enzyme 1.2-like [Tubulanus polymorphus]|uniref:hatching enzyme 1.2-like n=1 Tax=Tubulanus polymorphus TaxID=672921 RepID=UPI003DA647C6